MLELTPRQQATLLSSPLFAALDTVVRDDLISRAQLRKFGDGQCIFNRGDPCNGFYIVLEGSVRISGIARSGQQAILTFYEPGSWFGEISIFDGLPRTHDAHAHKLTVLAHLHPADFETLLDRYPTLSRMFLRIECARLRLMAQVFEAYSTQGFEARLANRLLMLAATFGSPSSQGLRIELHLSQETLAQLVGATRQRINQVLQDWSHKGLVEQRRGFLALRDPAGLQRIAEG